MNDNDPGKRGAEFGIPLGPSSQLRDFGTMNPWLGRACPGMPDADTTPILAGEFLGEDTLQFQTPCRIVKNRAS